MQRARAKHRIEREERLMALSKALSGEARDTTSRHELRQTL